MKMGSAIAGAAAAVLALAAFGTAAQATEYKVQWSGDAYGNGATAVGYFDINTKVYPTGPATMGDNLPDPAFQVLSVTISGASFGNGTFGGSDFSEFYFWTPSPLNLTTELIGQSLGNGRTFGDWTQAGTGDFNLFNISADPLAPRGVHPFDLGADGGSGDQMVVTSIAPVAGVPEPATWSMLILGVGMIGFAARRRSLTAALAA